MPSDREEWTRGPWIPGWSSAQSRRPQHESEQQQQQPGHSEDGGHRRVPWGPYWTGEQPQPQQQQQRQQEQQRQQDDAGRGWRNHGGQQQWEPQGPHRWRPHGGHGQESDTQGPRDWRSQYGQESGQQTSRDWRSYGSLDRSSYGPPDGAGEESHHHPQGSHDPCRRQGEQGPRDPCQQLVQQPQQQQGHRACWGAAAITGAGAYGLYRLVQSITPPGWM